jgi:hypothetical protein
MGGGACISIETIAHSVYLRITGWVAAIRFPAGGKGFSLLHSVQTGSGNPPASYSIGTGDLSRGVGQPGRGSVQ